MYMCMHAHSALHYADVQDEALAGPPAANNAANNPANNAAEYG